MITAELQEQLDSIKWWHRYDKKTFGFQTAGIKGCYSDIQPERWDFKPKLFKNRTVLDIGAWDGYFSYYAEKIGAKRVLAIDHPSWSGSSWGTKAGFDLVHSILNSKVESKDIDLYDTSPDNLGTFNTVLFLGVLYHLPHPLEGLKKAAALTNDLLVVETTYEEVEKDEPIFIHNPEKFQKLKDKTNHYSPNKSRLDELFIDMCGFKRVEYNFWSPGDRMICYAWK
jgi:tRNA (mo5U34)-methyltransferase